MDVALGRQPFEARHLPSYGGLSPGGGPGQRRNGLRLRVEFLEEVVEVVGGDHRLVGEPSMSSLAGDAVDPADLRPCHPCGLGVEQYPTFKRSDARREVVHSPDAIGGVRRVEKIPDVLHEDINDVAVVRLRLV